MRKCHYYFRTSNTREDSKSGIQISNPHNITIYFTISFHRICIFGSPFSYNHNQGPIVDMHTFLKMLNVGICADFHYHHTNNNPNSVTLIKCKPSFEFSSKFKSRKRSKFLYHIHLFLVSVFIFKEKTEFFLSIKRFYCYFHSHILPILVTIIYIKWRKLFQK